MPITDAERHRLHTTLEGVLGEADAGVLMSHLPPSGWSDVARTSDLDRLSERMDERFANQDERIDERFARVDERFAHLEQRIDERFARVDERFAHLDERFAHLDERFAHLDERFAHLDQRFALNEARLDVSLQTALREQTNRTIVALVAIITSVGVLIEMFAR